MFLFNNFPFKKKFFLLGIIIYLLYSFILIYKSSFVIDGVRYFSLFDDEMVSMRYAKNLSDGFGLVWNKGAEEVEGFTNPLWVFYMAIFHLLPIAQAKISLFIQLSGVLFLVVNLFFVKKIVEFFIKKSFFTLTLSFIFTAFYFPLNNWGIIQGTEVSILTLIISISTYLALNSLKKQNFSYFLYILLGIGTLVRFDMIVPSLIIFLFLFINDKKNRVKNLLIGFSIIAFFILVQTGLRFWYYKEILPNTYYLKLTGYPMLLRIVRGAYVLPNLMNPILFFIPIVLFIFKKNRYLLLLFFIFIGQVLYSVYVGGDAWEFYGGSNRYITIVVPLFFILFVIGLYEVKKFLEKTVNLKYYKSYKYSLYTFIFLSFILFNCISDNTPLQMLFIKDPITKPDNEFHVRVAQHLIEITDKNAKIAVAWAGTTPYFANDRYFIDLLGKNDKYIAHKNASKCFVNGDLRRLLCFYPGHMKWDYNYSLEKLKPDIVMEAYPYNEALPYLNKYYKKVNVKGMPEFFLLNDSKNISIKI